MPLFRNYREKLCSCGVEGLATHLLQQCERSKGRHRQVLFRRRGMQEMQEMQEI